jgi:hypothetical protein
VCLWTISCILSNTRLLKDVHAKTQTLNSSHLRFKSKINLLTFASTWVSHTHTTPSPPVFHRRHLRMSSTPTRPIDYQFKQEVRLKWMGREKISIDRLFCISFPIWDHLSPLCRALFARDEVWHYHASPPACIVLSYPPALTDSERHPCLKGECNSTILPTGFPIGVNSGA